MIDAAQRLDLPVEAGLCFAAHSGEHLEGDLPPQGRLPGPVNDTHSSLTEFAEELKLADRPLPRLGAGFSRVGWRVVRLTVGPFANLGVAHLHFQHAGQEFALLAP